MSAEAVRLLTTNHLTPAQIDSAGVLLTPKWGYGMAVAAGPDEVSATPDREGQYGGYGGYGTACFDDPGTGLAAFALTQTTDFFFNGGRVEFTTLALRAGR